MKLSKHAAASALALLSLALVAPPAFAEPPAQPRVIDDIPMIGKPGGSVRTLVGRARDTRLLNVFGYATLVNYTPELELVPDILLDMQVEDGRSFTMTLRDGHKWSDGQPFTTEDFRFWWEDVAQNPDIMPSGPPVQLLVDGELPKVEILDAKTVRYSWSKPNPFFMPSLAGPAPMTIYLPAHYLKQFHKTYTDQAQIDAAIAATKSRDWAQLWDR
jgi:peptide/nickel transport system substrate-binding protein